MIVNKTNLLRMYNISFDKILEVTLGRMAKRVQLLAKMITD